MKTDSNILDIYFLIFFYFYSNDGSGLDLYGSEFGYFGYMSSTPRAWADGLEQLCAQDRTETAAALLLADHLVKG